METAPFHEAIARGPAGGRAFWLTAEDGVRLRLGVWPVPEGAKGTVFLLPGRTEYVEKYGPAAADLGARGYAMLAVDWRGQGLADRPLDDPLKGHVAHFPDFQRDLAAVIAAATALELPRPWFILGHYYHFLRTRSTPYLLANWPRIAAAVRWLRYQDMNECGLLEAPEAAAP